MDDYLSYGPWFEQPPTKWVIPEWSLPQDKEFDILVLHPEGNLEDIWFVYCLLEFSKRKTAGDRIQRRETDSVGGLIILANESVVAMHQTELERRGIVFLPNWRETEKYRHMVRYALENGGGVYLMEHGETSPGREGWFPKKVNPEDVGTAVDIVDYDGKIDILPIS